VLDAAGERTGRVSEVRCSGRPRGEQQSPLRVERILYTPHLAGSELGYSVDRDQGPALVRRFVRTWQQRDRIVDVADVEGLDELKGDLRLTTSARPRHPHDD
jgi:hypothetical protein